MTIESPMIPPTRRAFINTIAALPIAAAAPAATAQTLDAELIELGARFEPLVDRYYVARKPGRVRGGTRGRAGRRAALQALG